MIFQDPYSSLNPRKTVGAIIAEPFVIHGVAGGGVERKRARAGPHGAGRPQPRALQPPSRTSSPAGQRQRIGVARAIALGPKLIVADEPVSALDVSIQAQILNLLRDLQRDLGLTIVFIAHDLSVVRHMCDRIAVMYLGKIVELAPSAELYSRPRHPYTGALLSAVPVPDPLAARTAAPDPHRRHAVADQPAGGVSLSHALPERRGRPLRRRRAAAREQGGPALAACHYPLSTDDATALAGAVHSK